MGDKGKVPKGATVSEIGEDALIARLVRLLPATRREVVVGPGDDCAVLRSARAGWYDLLKTDCIVEGVHFLREAKPERIGWKAMARVVSDIAATGGIPASAVVTLLLPKDWPVVGAEGIYRGIAKAARNYGVDVVGGETSSASRAMLSVSMTGRVERKCCVLRSGGKAGDVLFASGRLGGSLSGKHLTFEPRQTEARWLVKTWKPHAMMDLSDGLAKDLPRLAAASGVGFELDLAAVPRTRGCTLAQSLGDGEDYELLLAMAPKNASRLGDAWKRRFPGLPLTRIGKLVPDPEQRTTLVGGGWEHFRK
jgi:thiamine-monophosphate kinase